MTCVLHTSIYELLEESSRTLRNLQVQNSCGCNRGVAVEADAIGEQQSKPKQSGSSTSSLSRHNQEAVKADAIGEQQL